MRLPNRYRLRAIEQRKRLLEAVQPRAPRQRKGVSRGNLAAVLPAPAARPPLPLLALTALVWLGATLLVARQGMLRAYADALAHELTARRVVDALEPGLARLGTVWLPLPPLLLLPLVSIDPIWASGLAGALLGLPALLLATGSLFLAGATVGGRVAGMLAAALLLINPNVVYLFTTPMTEAPALAFSCLALAGLARALASFQQGTVPTSAILAASIGSAGALLSRYDGWVLTAFVGGALLVGGWLRPRGEAAERSLAVGILFALIPLYAILLWLLYNLATYGDPLAFLLGPYSSGSIVQDLVRAGQIPTVGGRRIEEGDPLQAAATYTQAVLECFGPAALVFTVAGLVAAALQLPTRWAALTLGVATAPFWFYLLALTTSQSVIITRAELPEGLFNVRYGTTLAPLVALAPTALLALFRGRVQGTLALMIVSVALASAVLLALEPRGPVVYAEGVLQRSAVNAVASQQAATWLASQPDDGFVLMADFSQPLAKYLLTYGSRPVRRFITESDYRFWDGALADPVGFRAGQPPQPITYLVMLAPTSKQYHLDPIAARFGQTPPRGFRVAFRNSEVVIFRREVGGSPYS
ncbi:MAG: hypothetical protein K6U89_01250 [Chloroflexi bacterium]|nr:hypothetical protein [Chloroflexota bacterium]